MIDHGRHLDDEALGSLLTTLGSGLAWPSAEERVPDMATRVRVAIAASGVEPRARSGGPGSWRRARRAALLAVAALLALAAVAGAVGLGLPGLRLILAEPPATPSAESSNGTPGGPTSPLPSAPGEGLGLGTLVTLAEADDQVDRSIPAPTDPAVGPPDAVYVDPARGGQVALVWAARPGLPETLAPGVGMILMSYDGALFEGYYQKVVGGGSSVERVAVNGNGGFWINGDPHVFFYEREDGTVIDDPRRWVGDALIWSDGVVTYRLETAAGRDAALAIAESVE
ncbi:MAG: hypothetical protein ABIQ58_04855 [Candidatus Limnocylindrales bacterium]